MAGQSNYDPKTEQAEGFPKGVTVELVNTLHATASLRGRFAANACKAALALALLKQYGFEAAAVTQVIVSMGEDNEAN